MSDLKLNLADIVDVDDPSAAAEALRWRRFIAKQIDLIMDSFKWQHLPARLQEVSKPFCALAEDVRSNLHTSTECLECLRKLLESKDCAVRAALQKDS